MNSIDLLKKDTYYDLNKKEYLVFTPSGWMPHTEAQLKRRLRSAGISTKPAENKLTSPADDQLLRIQDNNAISYAGPLAGYESGVYEMFGRKILVTENPRFISPNEGDWSLIKQVLEAVLHDKDHDQLTYFHGWLKVALSSLYEKKYQPGQALAMAGPIGCGKSLIQKLVTEILGGRVARPYSYMIGSTDFNAELFAAEHLMIEDEAPTNDHKARRKFGSFIKQLTVNMDQRLHAKKRDALMLTPRWRVTISINDEKQDLTVLPMIDGGLEDKMILFRAYSRTLPLQTGEFTDRDSFWKALVSQLPAFIHFLIHEFTTPSDLISERFGITHFQHPDLARALMLTDKSERLMTLIEQHLLNGKTKIVMSAREIKEALEEKIGDDINRFLPHQNSCGTYLGLLKVKYGNRIIHSSTGKERFWTIHSADTPDTLFN